MMPARFSAIVSTVVSTAILTLVLGACAGQEPAAPAAPTGNIQVIAAGTALPAGYKIDSDRTTIFGTDEKWTGRLTYTTSLGADEVFDFLHKEMPNFGWVEVTAMRSDLSLLTFTSAGTGRMATVNIMRASTLGSTRVDMVVSPHSKK